MQKNYKLVKRSLIALSLFSVFGVSAQTQEEEFYDVIFDGKPAKMSSKTGEVKFVNSKSTTSTKLVNNAVAAYKPSTSSSTTSFYNVKPGETFYSIAKKHGLSVSELKSLNSVEGNTLSIGQELKVSEASVVSQSDQVYSVTTTSTSNNGFWVVEKGDTLYRIATSSGISVEELKSLNNLSSNIISIGQRLITKNN
jgi:peptidoglycan endopeptidase LytE